MGSFVAGLDATVVNVALPAIEEELGGGLAGQQWVSNGYLLALGSLILIGGSLGDVLGERRVFSIGVAGFGVASLLCTLAPSIEVLVAARVLQGIFGALLAPSALAVIVAAFPPDERGAAIGSWTAWSGIATVIGPFLGGWLVDTASWRWIFALNVPFVLATLVLVEIAIPPPERGGARRRIDVRGAMLCAIGPAGPVYGLIRQPEAGWSSVQVLGPILGGVAVLAAFLWHERRTIDPMLPLDLFRRRNFTRRPLRAAPVHGCRPTRRGGRPGVVRPDARAGRLRSRRAAGPAALLARPRDDRRAADHDRARRCRRAQRRNRLGHQHRGRACLRACSRSPRSAPWWRRRLLHRWTERSPVASCHRRPHGPSTTRATHARAS